MILDFIAALRVRNAATDQFRDLICVLNDAQDDEKKDLMEDEVQDMNNSVRSRSRSRSRSDSLSDNSMTNKIIIQEKTEELLHYKVQIAGLYKQLESKDDLIHQLNTKFTRYDSLVQKMESELETKDQKSALLEKENSLLVDQLMSHKNNYVDEMNDMIGIVDKMKMQMMTEMLDEGGPIWSVEESEEFSSSGISSSKQEDGYEFVQLLDSERIDSLSGKDSSVNGSISGISGSSSSKLVDPKFEFCLEFPNSISDVQTRRLASNSNNTDTYMALTDFDGTLRVYSLNLHPSERESTLLYEKQFSTSLLKCDLNTHVESTSSEAGANLRVKVLGCDANGNVSINGISHDQSSGAIVQDSRSTLRGASLVGTFDDYPQSEKERINTAKFFLSNEVVAASAQGSLLFYSGGGGGGGGGGYRMHNSITVNASIPVLDIDIKEGNIACLSKDNSVAFVDHRTSSPSHIMHPFAKTNRASSLFTASDANFTEDCTSHINSLQWSPVDRNSLILASPTAIMTVDMRMYSRVQTIMCLQKTALAKVNYSFCGKYFFVPLMNGMVQLYESSSGKLMYHIKSGRSGTSAGHARNPCLGCQFINQQHVVAFFQNHIEIHSL